MPSNKENGVQATEVPAKAKLINPLIFETFKTLTSQAADARVNGGVKLLQHFSHKSIADDEAQDKVNKEKLYSLKRLVRGVGASSLSSRAGFYTALVGFLKVTEDFTVSDILDVITKELHIGNKISHKEDSDALVGQVLVLGAIIRAGKLDEATADDIVTFTDLLLRASKEKTFHANIAANIVVELTTKIASKSFRDNLWPILKEEYDQIWSKHNINTVYVALTVNEHHPDLIGDTLMKAKSTVFENLRRVFLNNQANCTHPAYPVLGRFLARNTLFLEKFWATVEFSESGKSANQEMSALKLFTEILKITPNYDVVPKMFTTHFVKMLCEILTKSSKDKLPAILVEVNSFFDALFECAQKHSSTESKYTLEIIEKLIFPPGNIQIEKHSNRRIIYQLIGTLHGAEEIQSLFGGYKKVFANGKSSPAERLLAAQMMKFLYSHQSVVSSLKWRREQMCYLMNVGLFRSNGNGELITDKKKENDVLGKDLSTAMRQIFYQCLETKLPRLQDVLELLLALADQFAANMKRSNGTGTCVPATAPTVAMWDKVRSIVKTQKGKNDESEEGKMHLVFNVLLLKMGLQLFHKPEMDAIRDLITCIEKVNKKRGKKQEAKSKSDDKEPEWIEVVVELLLYLLSLNANYLRTTVQMVFGHLCRYITVETAHQMLQMLDMSDDKNPLTEDGASGDEANSDSEDEEENGSDMEEDDADNDEEEEDDDDDDDDDEAEESSSESEDDIEEATVTDQLRIALSSVLLPSSKESDDESIDLNDMKDDEAARLDEALAAAFSSIKKSGTNKKIKTKQERFKKTTLMHFRIRVLDLVEIYLKSKPSLVITMEILLALATMNENCIRNELQPLTSRVDRVLVKLASIRQFSSVAETNPTEVMNTIQTLIEKRINGAALLRHQQLLEKCMPFFVAAATASGDEGEKLLTKLFSEFIMDFIQSRNSKVSQKLLQRFFNLRWNGLWSLCDCLLEHGLVAKVRTLRRAQSLDFVAITYKNNSSETQLDKKQIRNVELRLQRYIEMLQNDDAINVSAIEFKSLAALLQLIHKHHLGKKGSTMDWESVAQSLQAVEKKLEANATCQTYVTLCKLLKASDGVEVAKVKENGHANGNGVAVKRKNNVKAGKSKKAKIVNGN